MPKRKLEQEARTELSDLSPPPNGLLDVGQVEGGANGVAKPPSGKKRKTKHTAAEVVETASKLTRAVRKKAVKYEEEAGSDEKPRSASSKSRKQKVEAGEDTHLDVERETATSKTKKRNTRVKIEEEAKVEAVSADEQAGKKVKRKRKTKEEKEAEAMPLAARTLGHKLFIGAHVSSAGGRHCAFNSLGRQSMLRVLQASTIAFPTASISVPMPSHCS